MSKSQEHHKHNSASGVFLVMICWRLNFVYLFGAWSEALCNSFADCESQEREEKQTFSCIECKSAWAFAVSILSAASHIQLLDPNFTALIYSWFGNSCCGCVLFPVNEKPLRHCLKAGEGATGNDTHVGRLSPYLPWCDQVYVCLQVKVMGTSRAPPPSRTLWTVPAVVRRWRSAAARR